MGHKKQIFFCPKADSKESCLEPREFDQSELLQCAEEAVPVVKKLSTTLNTCGMDDKGLIYEILYEVSYRIFKNVSRFIICTYEIFAVVSIQCCDINRLRASYLIILIAFISADMSARRSK